MCNFTLVKTEDRLFQYILISGIVFFVNFTNLNACEGKEM